MSSNNEEGEEEGITLRDEQIELLSEAEKIWRRGDEPVVNTQSATDAVRDALSTSLIENNGLREETVERMDLEALGAQFSPVDGEDGEAPSIAPLSQNAETGGDPEVEAAADPADEADEFSVESLSHGELNDMYSDIRKSALMANRGIPNRAAEIREEVASEHGCEADDLPSKDELQGLLGD